MLQLFISLWDIFIESGLTGEGSVKGVFSGKHYNRSIFCHKVTHEALQRVPLEVFLDTLDEDVLDGIYSFIADTSDSIFYSKGVQEYVESTQFDI